MEKAAVVEKVETTGVSTVAAIEDEIEPVPELVKVSMPSPTKQKAKKEKPEAFPATPKELFTTIKKTASMMLRFKKHFVLKVL